ncbi:DUF2784 domain-containing protein [Caldimonas sp. KR1-144]|uniref:DUF2784 domain-containing protein n=1 Tax=Caldimonas sp. KR1-144 TaxID=3400911 RepID=UPI003BFAA9DA
MLQRLLADALVALHLGFVAFVLAGGLLVWRWPRVAWLHLPAVAWAVWIECTAGICPLTPLENALRRAGGEAAYAGSFVEQYLVPLLYPPGLTPALQIGLGAFVLLLNGVLYALGWRKARSRPRPR